jgi:hypothetical protein
VARKNFEKDVVKKWLGVLVPEIVDKGGDERMLLGIVEHLVVGTLHVTREVWRVDPQRAFEVMRRQIEQRLADMEGEMARKKAGLILPS